MSNTQDQQYNEHEATLLNEVFIPTFVKAANHALTQAGLDPIQTQAQLEAALKIADAIDRVEAQVGPAPTGLEKAAAALDQATQRPAMDPALLKAAMALSRK